MTEAYEAIKNWAPIAGRWQFVEFKNASVRVELGTAFVVMQFSDP